MNAGHEGNNEGKSKEGCRENRELKSKPEQRKRACQETCYQFSKQCQCTVTFFPTASPAAKLLLCNTHTHTTPTDHIRTQSVGESMHAQSLQNMLERIRHMHKAATSEAEKLNQH